MNKIDWEEFDHIHVIKKFKQILRIWWNVDVLITDEKGLIQESAQEKVKFNSLPLGAFLSNDKIKNNFQHIVLKSIEEIKSTRLNYKISPWTSIGDLQILISPIFIENDIMGAVLGIGFLLDSNEDKKSEISKTLASLGLPSQVSEKFLSQIKTLNNNECKYLSKLIQCISEEISHFHEAIISIDKRIKELNKNQGSTYKYDYMIGQSQPMKKLYSLLDKIKVADSTVLIHGENGTGKELIAKSIYLNSLRKNKPFIIQNCSSFNDNLLESELFGHVKGSFTGAIRDKMGLFEKANLGTLFLDEIGDTSAAMQVKLLRVLQEGTFTPVGALEPKKVDVRIIAATNKNLKKMVEKELFREDLYYRLNVINIDVPPLRERRDDITLIAEYFLNKNSKEMKKTIHPKAMKKLYNYRWPGNVRELQNEMERISVLSSNERQIKETMLSEKILEAHQNFVEREKEPEEKENLKEAIEKLERRIISNGLRRTGWNKSKLAKELGISRANLIMKIERYNLNKKIKTA